MKEGNNKHLAARCLMLAAGLVLGLDLEDDVTLPVVLINDGRVIRRNLTICGRDENWLRKQLSREKVSSPREVFLLTLDEQGQVFCVRKEPAS